MVFGVKKYVLFVISMMIGIALMAQKPPISHLEINHVRPTILGDGTCYYPSSWDPMRSMDFVHLLNEANEELVWAFDKDNVNHG